MSSDQPAMVQEVHEKASSLDSMVEELEEFQADIATYIDQLQGMEPTEREAFYDQADSILQQVDDATTVADLLELEEEVEEAIKAPLQQVALQSLDEFLAALDPDLRDSTLEDIRNNLGQRLPQDLETTAETYQEITPIVRNLPATAMQLIAASIEQTPSDLLSPSTDVKPKVIATQERFKHLEELETIFEEAGDWAPVIDFVTTEANYQDLQASVPTETVRERLDKINETLIDLSSAPFTISSVVETVLAEQLATADLSSMASRIQDLRDTLTAIRGSYQDTQPYFQALETFGTDQGVFEEEIDDLLVEKNQLSLQEYATLEALQDEIDELNESLQTLIRNVHQRLKAQRAMVEVLEGEQSSDTPELNLGTGSTLLAVHVQDNLLQALQDCQIHHEWIINQLQVGDDDVEQEQLLEIWQRLSQGEAIALTEDVQDAILSLSQQLSLSVVLQSE